MKQNKKEKKIVNVDKKIPIQNYIIVVGVILLTVVGVFYLSSWYKNDQAYQKTIPVLRNVVAEITEEEFDHYVLENETALFYFCTVSETKCRVFEQELVPVIKKQKLQDKIIYVSIKNDNSNFLNDFNKMYQPSESFTGYPAFYYFQDGKIMGQLQQKSDNEPLKIVDAKRFLTKYGFGA